VPRQLPLSGGWVLEQDIPGTTHRDARGCYPLFTCSNWSAIGDDLARYAGDWVAVYMVLDPFGQYSTGELGGWFKDVVLPFKEHFVVDLGKPLFGHVTTHHRRYARKALRSMTFRVEEEPAAHVETWISLYKELIEQRHITGIAAFSPSAFSRQFEVPGIHAVCAQDENQVVGMQLWYVDGEVGYYHLGASTQFGRDHHAGFGMFWTAIEYFHGTGLRWLNLGGGAGVQARQADGLREFKRKWSTDTRTAYFCGRILDEQRYASILEQQGIVTGDFFPAYRANEYSPK
jgi:hypothetical protein